MLLLISFMLIYIVVGSQLAVSKFKFGHETGLIMVMGAILSAFFFFFDFEWRPFKLGPDFLFYYALPLILFAEGYNMHRS